MRLRLIFVALGGAAAGLAAGAAQAQGVFASNQPMLNEHMHTFEIRTRPSDADDNPTGFGKPGMYWSLPTGSHIHRGATPSERQAAKTRDAAHPAPPAAKPPAD